MPVTAINFDDVAVVTHRFTKDGHAWDLRDDLDSLLMMEIYNTIFQAADIHGTVGAQLATQPEQLRQVIGQTRQIAEEMRGFCLRIFQHSYPALTADQLNAAFGYDEQVQIVQYFFSRRGNRSAPPPVPTPEASTMPAVMTTPGTTMPRKKRRRKPASMR